MSATHKIEVDSKTDLTTADLRRLLAMFDAAGDGTGIPCRLHAQVSIGGHVRKLWVEIEHPDPPHTIPHSPADDRPEMIP